MGLNISGLFQNHNIANQNNASNVTGLSDKGQAGTSNGNNALSNLSPGSSIAGKVVSAENGNVTIKLADSSYVTASLKGNIALEPGSQVSFLVSSNQNRQVTLSPLFTNLLAASPSVENALHAASLPVNESTAAMVTQMMEQGMGIDKDSLQAMYKDVASNPNIDSGVVVRLSQMNLAINEMNAEQLRAYDNLNHQISGSIDDIAKGLQDAFSQVSNEDGAKAMQMFSDIIKLLSDGQDSASINSEANASQGVAEGSANAVNGEELAQNQNGVGNNAVISTEQSLQDALTKAIADASQNIGGMDAETVQAKSEFMIADKGLAEIVGKEDLQNLLDTLSKATPDASKDALQELAKGNLSSNDALKLIEQFMKDNSISAKVLSEPAIGKMMQNALESNWLLKPEDVADKEKMDSFYEQLKNQTAKLAEAAESVLGKEAPLTQSTTQLSQNIDFLNQLNQTFTYVQIPLKMSGQNANGDLYVYTNKKHLSEDGSVSAFLHLDMDHLGSVDCYVTMQSEKVSTNFKVQDDEILDLIEANIDILNERLQNRGYSLNVNVAVKEEETSVIEEIEKELGQGSIPISKVSFDARA